MKECGQSATSEQYAHGLTPIRNQLKFFSSKIANTFIVNRPIYNLSVLNIYWDHLCNCKKQNTNTRTDSMVPKTQLSFRFIIFFSLSLIPKTLKIFRWTSVNLYGKTNPETHINPNNTSQIKSRTTSLWNIFSKYPPRKYNIVHLILRKRLLIRCADEVQSVLNTETKIYRNMLRLQRPRNETISVVLNKSDG